MKEPILSYLTLLIILVWSKLIYFKTPSQNIIYSEPIISNISLPLKFHQNCLHSLPCCRRRRHETTPEDLKHASSEDSCYVKFKQFWNIIREMVSFELGKEIEKDVFSSFHVRRTKKNPEPPWLRKRTSNLWPQSTLRRFQNRMNGFSLNAVSE